MMVLVEWFIARAPAWQRMAANDMAGVGFYLYRRCVQVVRERAGAR